MDFSKLNDQQDLTKNQRRNLRQKFEKMYASVDKGSVERKSETNPKHNSKIRRNIANRIDKKVMPLV